MPRCVCLSVSVMEVMNKSAQKLLKRLNDRLTITQTYHLLVVRQAECHPGVNLRDGRWQFYVVSDAHVTWCKQPVTWPCVTSGRMSHTEFCLAARWRVYDVTCLFRYDVRFHDVFRHVIGHDGTAIIIIIIRITFVNCTYNIHYVPIKMFTFLFFCSF